MRDLIYMYFLFARYIWGKIKLKINFVFLGRLSEGVAIGIYANVIGSIVASGFTFKLTILILIAIILTYTSYILQEK